MTQLNQIIAIMKGVKSKAERDLTDLHREVLKTPLLSGITRVYSPKDDDGDRFPSESTPVQVKARDSVKNLSAVLTRPFDVQLTLDAANATATGNVIVDGTTLLADVPVAYLLFLEKQLIKIRTFMAKLPTLDPSESWTLDTVSGVYATPGSGTVKTKKVPKAFTKAEATPQHPAQVDTFFEDVFQGTWETKKFSGALPADRVQELVNRVDLLTDAVKFAREEANAMTVVDQRAGRKIFDYLIAE